VKLKSALLALLFPAKCPFCARIVSPGGICAQCEKSIPYTRSNCRRKGDFFTRCVSPLYYESGVRESLIRFKFNNCKHYAAYYAPLVYDCIAQEFNCDFDIISWVPVSKKRLRKRGYDQSRILAEEVASLFGTQAIPVLEKHRHCPAQSGMGTAEKRKANISGCYRCLNPDLIEDKRILLIDDIITTGATLSECAKTLLRAGAGEVLCATVARDRD